MAFKRCACCGAYLDPGEHCDCDDYEQPEREMARRPVARQRTLDDLIAKHLKIDKEAYRL